MRFFCLRFKILRKEMAAIAQGGLEKLKSIFQPYLYDNVPGLICGIVESKVHVERSLIATGMFVLPSLHTLFYSRRSTYYSLHLFDIWLGQ